MAFDIDTMYGPYVCQAKKLTVPMAAVTQVVPENLQRIALIMGVSSVQNVQVSIRNTLLQTEGLTLSTTGMAYLEMRVQDYGPLVGQAWFANAAAASALEVIEVIRIAIPGQVILPKTGSPDNVTGSAPQVDSGDNGYATAGSKPAARWSNPESSPSWSIRDQLYGRGGSWLWDKDSGGYYWQGDVGLELGDNGEGTDSGDQ